ncbi:hypothetical protein LOTGIDRAFT_173651 [Lottia gigantea]|uniref:PX domain-containing protein n=1 Tax=Lottia gigantea TaxID=225164 RepID=V4AQW9_LOTGI|nr:hypothetical protein LOTGIDRAFT_173651 [Lottia gigantea]ESO99642.1 hypothetical protein LOTGIDRAFT_173651 [Lottia gigantea]
MVTADRVKRVVFNRGIVKEPDKSGKSYAIFAITVKRKVPDSEEETVTDVYRRYSDFHDLHMLITETISFNKHKNAERSRRDVGGTQKHLWKRPMYSKTICLKAKLKCTDLYHCSNENIEGPEINSIDVDNDDSDSDNPDV